jgi:hypothetical protein
MARLFGKQAAQPLDLFDFWVGDWDVSWSGGKGRNQITKILDGKVLEESFMAAAGTGGQPPLKGRSVSVFDTNGKTWRQTWVDNQGGFIVLAAHTDGDKRIFQTAVRKNGNKESASRMVFYNIQKNSFTWDWESSQDGGKTWQLSWRIEYKRR